MDFAPFRLAPSRVESILKSTVLTLGCMEGMRRILRGGYGVHSLLVQHCTRTVAVELQPLYLAVLGLLAYPGAAGLRGT